MTHQLFQRDHHIHFQTRAQKHFDQHAFLHHWAKDQIIDRLMDIKKEFADKIILGDRMTMDGFRNIPLTTDSGEFLPLEPASCDCIISIL